MELGPDFRFIVHPADTAVDFAHGHYVLIGITHKVGPLDRMRSAGIADLFTFQKMRTGKKAYANLADLILGLVLRDLQNRAELRQGARQTDRER